MKKYVSLCMLSRLLPSVALAESPGSDWNSTSGFGGSSRHLTNQAQADLIARRDAGYYQNIGQLQVYNISTTTIGTMTTESTTISGNNNSVSSVSSSSGSLDASVQLQSLSSSNLSQNRLYDKAP